jgi:two-component system nitrogen regulation sensor histidine kinase NtrY
MVEEERRPLLPLIVAAVLFCLLLWLVFFLKGEANELTAEAFSGNYLGFLFLINVNIILVMVFGFLVVKNIIKLVLDRRRGLVGAGLRTRLVVAFVGLALVPTVLLLLISRGIVNSVFQYWFSPQVTSAVDGALAIARYQYDSLETGARVRSEILARRLAPVIPRLMDVKSVLGEGVALSAEAKKKRETLGKILSEKAEELGFAEVTLFRRDGSELISYKDERLLAPGPHLNPNLASLHKAVGEGIITVTPERTPGGELIRAYVPIKKDEDVSYVLLTSVAETERLTALLSQVLDAYEDYRELRTYRIPLSSSYTLTLVVVSLLIVFAAVWVGFFLAKSISQPIQQLAEGTAQVARGNLAYRIPDVGRDELRMLVDSFNRMTADLARTAGELEERRRYMETVLQSVGVGVLSVDPQGIVKTCNRAAAEILGLAQDPVGLEVSRIGVPELAQSLASEEKLFSRNLSLIVGGRSRHLQIIVTALDSDTGKVVLVDDLTELVQAQRSAAWQEVARRMAHEIKNPLTPIQLGAQRIERRLDNIASGDDRVVIVESVQTIVSAVETLRNLVSEFSRFSRLPKASPEKLDLVRLVDRISSIFEEANPQVKFRLESAKALEVTADREQLEAVMTNLYENAIQSIERAGEQRGEIFTAFEQSGGTVIVRVSDNGAGVPDEDKTRLFEPYFSTRKGGTGLGLAIVQAIISDHGGKITVFDNQPKGAVFEFELPLA